VSPHRRALLVAAAGLAARSPAAASAVQRGRALAFPRDHGAHLEARTEWWYATGWLDDGRLGFQVTFFRSRTGYAQGLPGRFAPRHLLFAHTAVSDVARQRHLHDERIVRWAGDPAAALGRASQADADVAIGRWALRRDGGGATEPARWLSTIAGRGFDLQLEMQRTQPVLLQGDAGFSRKGPEEAQASHYYSEPQLATRAQLALDGAPARSHEGRAWLDHEWSDELLHPQAVGWDWIGFNLFDGGALTAFQLRRRDGSALWTGGSFRAAGAASRSFADGEVRCTAGRRWRSAGTATEYPVEWLFDTPAGRWRVRALFDAQELDSRGSTGSIYWEGLSELLDGQGRRVGLGYLEMTGYAAPLRLG
jgi:predicted secreted hydrolase